MRVAPRTVISWMSRAGLEWVFRLAHDPGRLARRPRAIRRGSWWLTEKGDIALPLSGAVRPMISARPLAKDASNGYPPRRDLPRGCGCRRLQQVLEVGGPGRGQGR